MMKSKVRTRFLSFLDIIAGSAGGGAIILGLLILILVLIIRSVFLKDRCTTKKANYMYQFSYKQCIYYVKTKKELYQKLQSFFLPQKIMNGIMS